MKIMRNLREKIYGIKWALENGSVYGGPGIGKSISIPADQVNYSISLKKNNYDDVILYQISFNEIYKESGREIGGGGWPKAVMAHFKAEKKGLQWYLTDNLNDRCRSENFDKTFTKKGAEKEIYARAYKTASLVSRLTGVPVEDKVNSYNQN